MLLTSQGAFPLAYHVWPHLWECNQRIQKQTFEVRQTQTKENLSQSKVTKHRFSPNTCF